MKTSTVVLVACFCSSFRWPERIILYTRL